MSTETFFTDRRLRRRLEGTIAVPGDKSITHRALLFSVLAAGETEIYTNIFGRDNLASARIIEQLGATLELELPDSLIPMAKEEGIRTLRSTDGRDCIARVTASGRQALKKPEGALYCGNSGTTARLLCGLLAACPFSSTLTGDESLSRRPFGRVNTPLRQMGARISSDNLPLEISGGELQGIHYDSPVSSAQVKTAIILAGLAANGPTSVSEPFRSRDHTERMLKAMGAPLSEQVLPGGRWQVMLREKPAALAPLRIRIPGDLSAAAFFITLAAIADDADVLVEGVGLNPTRSGVLSVLKRMGANIEVKNERLAGGEPVADIRTSSSRLCAVDIGASDVAAAIDEIPILCVAAAFASGQTVLSGAGELRVKESDRLRMMHDVLSDFGVKVSETPEGLVITGGGVRPSSNAAKWRSSGDHRIAMCGAILDYLTVGAFELIDAPAVETSFPDFIRCFHAITASA